MRVQSLTKSSLPKLSNYQSSIFQAHISNQTLTNANTNILTHGRTSKTHQMRNFENTLNRVLRIVTVHFFDSDLEVLLYIFQFYFFSHIIK